MKKIFITLSTIALLLVIASTCTSYSVETQINEANNSVINDAITQYNIVKKNGDPIEIYNQASLVAVAYLQANDSINYKKWKEIEKQEAIKAGIDF